MSKTKTQTQTTTLEPDRRAHDRFSIDGAKVEYMKVEFLAFVDKDMQRTDDVVNVSQGGMLFASDEGFPLGQHLSLLLHLPHQPGTSKMRGQVVRAAPPDGSDHCLVGVRFTMCCSGAADMLQALAQECESAAGRVKLYVSDGQEA